MCTGAEIAIAAALAAASAGGSYLQNQAAIRKQDAEIEASNNVTREFLRKNSALEAEANDVFKNRLQQENAPVEQQAKPFHENRQAAAENLSSNIDQVLAPLRGGAPRVVKSAVEDNANSVEQQAAQERDSLAKVRSFGDLLFNKGLQTNDAARQIGTVGGLVQANADLVPLQQQLAISQVQGTGGGMNLGGQLLSGLGSFGATAAGSGAFDGLLSGSSGLAPTSSPVPVRRPVRTG